MFTQTQKLKRRSIDYSSLQRYLYGNTIELTPKKSATTTPKSQCLKTYLEMSHLDVSVRMAFFNTFGDFCTYLNLYKCQLSESLIL